LLLKIYKKYSKELTLNVYSTLGIRAECDFMFWRIGNRLEAFEQMSSDLMNSPIGKFLHPVYSFLSMTKYSRYVSKHKEMKMQGRKIAACPARKKYLFVYPFVKKAEWYQLSEAERKVMMKEHIGAGILFPSIKINTSYSFGIDDQEQVVGFETDYPEDFLDLVETMRFHKARPYTERDIPIVTCIYKEIEELISIL
jgi:chlorite dismutase